MHQVKSGGRPPHHPLHRFCSVASLFFHYNRGPRSDALLSHSSASSPRLLSAAGLPRKMQAALLSSDPYARRLAQWFTKLDGLDALKRPGRPPDQDQQVQDERLKALLALLAFARNQTPLVRLLSPHPSAPRANTCDPRSASLVAIAAVALRLAILLRRFHSHCLPRRRLLLSP